jgi:hypothetical protein
VATSATADYATYTANAPALQLLVLTSGACWLELREGSASGPVIYEGTLVPGASHAFRAVGSIWLRLGDPARVRLSINGTPVALPAAANPFDVTVTGPTGT